MLMHVWWQQGAQQAKSGAALRKLQELQAAEGAELDERGIQIAAIEVQPKLTCRYAFRLHFGYPGINL